MLDFLVLVLAVLRLYYLFATDNGPGNVLLNLRMKVGIKYDHELGALPTNNFAFVLLCPMCSTLWYGLFLGVLYTLYPGYTIAGARVLALSMAAIILMNLQQKRIAVLENN